MTTTALQDLLGHELRQLGHAAGVASITPLSGGYIASVWLVTLTDHTHVIAKTLSDGLGDMFLLEAEGLAALRATGTVEVPNTLAVTDRLLILEQLPRRTDSAEAWDAFGRDLGAMHRGTVHNQFGWPHDNWRGKVRQSNAWSEDGHAFFAEHRLLRYLGEAGSNTVLETPDRRALERLCERLPELIPSMPAVLAHGDIWLENVIGGSRRNLALLDPAVSYAWGELDLAMLYLGKDHLPAINHFLVAYQETNPSPDGWEERMLILGLVEMLSWIAHLGLVPLPDPTPAIKFIRHTLEPFYVS